MTDTATRPQNSVTGSDHYTIITADSHAGGSHAQYREYLDPKYRNDFDAWRGKYRNPFKDLKDDRRERNWDSDRRWTEQQADGVIAEVIFPNTVPPFFPSFVLFARPPKPEEYEHRLAGIREEPRRARDLLRRILSSRYRSTVRTNPDDATHLAD